MIGARPTNVHGTRVPCGAGRCWPVLAARALGRAKQIPRDFVTAAKLLMSMTFARGTFAARPSREEHSLVMTASGLATSCRRNVPGDPGSSAGGEIAFGSHLRKIIAAL